MLGLYLEITFNATPVICTERCVALIYSRLQPSQRKLHVWNLVCWIEWRWIISWLLPRTLFVLFVLLCYCSPPAALRCLLLCLKMRELNVIPAAVLTAVTPPFQISAEFQCSAKVKGQVLTSCTQGSEVQVTSVSHHGNLRHKTTKSHIQRCQHANCLTKQKDNWHCPVLFMGNGSCGSSRMVNSGISHRTEHTHSRTLSYLKPTESTCANLSDCIRELDKSAAMYSCACNIIPECRSVQRLCVVASNGVDMKRRSRISACTMWFLPHLPWAHWDPPASEATFTCLALILVED